MTLYRTYRPKTFKEVVGRDAIKHILTEQLKTKTLTHAYLFSGIRGTGKTTLARLLAKAANCSSLDQATGEPCNECASCVAVNSGTSQDLVEIDAASNRRIEEIRQLREHIKYVPANSLYKVYIIDEVHMLTREAFNALLKTLEEPPAHAIFILATTELEKIPDTIFSRCQHFSFGRVPLKEIQERLHALLAAEKVNMDASVVLAIARRSSGSLRDAESLLGQILSIGKTEITANDASLFLPKAPFVETISFLSAIISRDAKQALELLSSLEEQGINFAFFMDTCLEYARHLLLFGATNDANRLALYFSTDEITEIQALVGRADQNRLREITVELLKASHDLSIVPDIPSLAFELVTVLLCAEKKVSVVAQAQETPKKELSKTKTIEPSAAVDFSRASVLPEDVAPIAEAQPERLVSVAPESALPVSITPKGGAHSLEEILDGWGEVLAKARDKNHALNFVLGVSEPIGISGNILELGFKFRLQQEKVSEMKNREIVETIIKEVYGTSYRISPTLKESLRPHKSAEVHQPAPQEDNLLKAALEVFEGAEVLN
ncbi:DNA polymerase III, subunit gamma and tau [bacterium CG10_46_32]|nr:MAG: DNA polymerase III, subunit gamma and tau [bacterium CG10_46_32]PIR55813.1 MAG: hypothetical protein COU73_04205 [Parcubacteria group bacterium CG10_big_fil_rev_8_21_14_0_10_46_32]